MESNVVVRQTMFDESIRNQQYNKHHTIATTHTLHIEFGMVATEAAAAVGENEFSMKFGKFDQIKEDEEEVVVVASCRNKIRKSDFSFLIQQQQQRRRTTQHTTPHTKNRNKLHIYQNNIAWQFYTLLCHRTTLLYLQT